MDEITTKRKYEGVVMDYYNKVIMAPMVRVGTLPMRLLAKRYGCDIVYSEELIDLKLQTTKRVVNETLNTIDFIGKDNSIVYRTNDEDTNNVLQIGTATAASALAASQLLVNDVCAIDVNMGCPKFFSVQGGMGSALLSKPETIKDILTTLIRNLPVPITCKIRLLSNDNETIDLLKVIESTGVKAIGVHLREIPERPRDPAHWDRLNNILSNASFSIPIIANGDIFVHSDIKKVKEQTKCNSVMIARGAIRNCSVFTKDSTVDPLDQVIKKYIKVAYSYDNVFQNTKYVLNSIITENDIQKSIEGKSTFSAKSYEDLCKVWGLTHEYKAFLQSKKENNGLVLTNSTGSTPTNSILKKHTLEESDNQQKQEENECDDMTSAEEPCLKRFRSKGIFANNNDGATITTTTSTNHEI